MFGFAGLRLTDSGWTVSPRLPQRWARLAFRFYHRGVLQRVEIDPNRQRVEQEGVEAA